MVGRQFLDDIAAMAHDAYRLPVQMRARIRTRGETQSRICKADIRPYAGPVGVIRERSLAPIGWPTQEKTCRWAVRCQ